MDFVVEDVQAQPVVIERDIVPAGVHEMVIKHAEEGPNQYKVTDSNPDGLCLKLRLTTSNGNYKFVFDDIPKHLGWRAKQLADAIGVSVASGKVSLEPHVLAGATLTVEVSHYTSKSGKVSAVVKRYMPCDGKPQPNSKPRTVAARIASASVDDIPF
jgi:hypothetical protein